MSWSLTVKAPRHAIDGELRAAFARAREQVRGNPTSQRVLTAHQETIERILHTATPHECDFNIQSNGHFSDDGTSGSAALRFGFGPHVEAPAPKTKEAKAAAPSDEE
jgi:hypothetical protein